MENPTFLAGNRPLSRGQTVGNRVDTPSYQHFTSRTTDCSPTTPQWNYLVDLRFWQLPTRSTTVITTITSFFN